MQVLVVGAGSIGKRHILNLMNDDNIKSILVFSRYRDYLDDFKNSPKLKPIDSLNDVKADCAIISNETHKHLSTALFLAEKGIHLFIEKPISHSLENVWKLREFAERNKIKIFVAYNLRFLGALNYVKEQIALGIIGKIYTIKIEVGQYLPSWRPSSDYRDRYSADPKRGGGVELDLSHEIDYMRFIFGNPISWKIIKTKVSDLEIQSNDLFEGLYQFKNNFICNIHLDYLQFEKKRKLRVIGSKGVLSCDMVKNKISVLAYDECSGKIRTVINIDDGELFDMDKTYFDEMRHFLNVVEGKDTPLITIDDGVKALKLLSDGNV